MDDFSAVHAWVFFKLSFLVLAGQAAKASAGLEDLEVCRFYPKTEKMNSYLPLSFRGTFTAPACGPRGPDLNGSAFFRPSSETICGK